MSRTDHQQGHKKTANVANQLQTKKTHPFALEDSFTYHNSVNMSRLVKYLQCSIIQVEEDVQEEE